MIPALPAGEKGRFAGCRAKHGLKNWESRPILGMDTTGLHQQRISHLNRFFQTRQTTTARTSRQHASHVLPCSWHPRNPRHDTPPKGSIILLPTSRDTVSDSLPAPEHQGLRLRPKALCGIVVADIGQVRYLAVGNGKPPTVFLLHDAPLQDVPAGVLHLGCQYAFGIIERDALCRDVQKKRVVIPKYERFLLPIIP